MRSAWQETKRSVIKTGIKRLYYNLQLVSNDTLMLGSALL